MNKYILKCEKNCKLLKFLGDNLIGYKHLDFLNALKQKDVLVNGLRTKDNIDIFVGDEIKIFLKDKKFCVDIFYEDENVIIFSKPIKIEVCDGSYNIKNEYEHFYNKQIFALHRLDAGTKGLVVFAKNKTSYEILLDAFKKHKVTKFYYAVVGGKPKLKDVFSEYLLKDEKNSKVKIFEDKVLNADHVELEYQLLNQRDDISLLNVKIKAGKTHQIRAQLAHNSLPIVGDDKYGNGEINKKFIGVTSKSAIEEAL